MLCCAALQAGCGAAPGSAGDAERGRSLIAQHQCGRCHTVPGVAGADGRLAVTLEAFGARGYIAGQVPNDDAHLLRWIVAPDSVVPDTTMPAQGVTPGDARHIAAYLRRQR